MFGALEGVPNYSKNVPRGTRRPVPHVRALAVSDQVEVRQAGAVALGADELTSHTPGKLSHLSCRAADEHARHSTRGSPRGFGGEPPAHGAEQRAAPRAPTAATRSTSGQNGSGPPLAAGGASYILVSQQIVVEQVVHRGRMLARVKRNNQSHVQGTAPCVSQSRRAAGQSRCRRFFPALESPQDDRSCGCTRAAAPEAQLPSCAALFHSPAACARRANATSANGPCSARR